MFQRHAGDRQHIGLGLEPATGVFAAQHIGQTFQHVDTDGTLARDPVARHRVIALRGILGRGNGHKARGRCFGKLLQAFGKRPQNQTQPGRRGFQQKRHENGELTKTQTMFAQGAARLLVQLFNLIGDGAARQDAQAFDHAKGKATGQPGQRLIPAEVQQGFKQGRDLAVDKMLQPALHLLGNVNACLIIDKGLNLGFQGIVTGHQFANGLIAPHQSTLFGEINFRVGRVVKTIRAQMKMWGQRLKRRLVQCFGFFARGLCILTEPEPFQTADEFAFYRHFTRVAHFGQEGLLLLEPAQQNTGAPVHKSLRQARVKRIRQSVFYSARLATPMTFVTYPPVALCHIGPGADKGQPPGQGINLTIGAVNPLDLACQPIVGYLTRLVNKSKYLRQ